MANKIASARNYTGILDEVYQRASVSSILNSPKRMVRAGRNAKEVMIPKIAVSGLGNYTRNVGYKTGSIEFAYETKAFNYDRGIRLMADVMDVEEAGVMDCFVQAGAELQRTQVAPEADAFTFASIAGHAGVTVDEADLADAEAGDVGKAWHDVEQGRGLGRVPATGPQGAAGVHDGILARGCGGAGGHTVEWQGIYLERREVPVPCLGFVPVRVKIVSNALRFGPMPEPGDIVGQRLAVTGADGERCEDEGPLMNPSERLHRLTRLIREEVGVHDLFAFGGENL